MWCQSWELELTYYWIQKRRGEKRKRKGTGLFPVSERSMHFNSNPLQVDLSQSRGPEREEKVEMAKAGGDGVLVGNGAWSAPSCSTEQLLWQSLLLRYCCAKRGPGSKRRRLTHELKASKFLSFHLLVASLVFNQSQKGAKRSRNGRRRKQDLGRERERMV